MTDATLPPPAVSPEEAARHAQKKARIKQARDRMMAEKTGEKGLVIVHTGPGKGKSSAGFGMILRCIAHGMPCAVVRTSTPSPACWWVSPPWPCVVS